jgi:hypothetical protein
VGKKAKDLGPDRSLSGHYRHGRADPIIAQWRGISYECSVSGPMAGSPRIYGHLNFDFGWVSSRS